MGHASPMTATLQSQSLGVLSLLLKAVQKGLQLQGDAAAPYATPALLKAQLGTSRSSLPFFPTTY